jgi:hypothetical protein
MTIRVISLHQPWASALFTIVKDNPLKRYETREWPHEPLGEVYVHAARKNHAKSPFQTINLLNGAEGLPDELVDFCLNAHELPIGVILGRVNFVACQEMWSKYINSQPKHERCLGFWEPGVFAFDFGEASDRLLFKTPIPFKAWQGKFLYVNQTDVIQAVKEQVRVS